MFFGSDDNVMVSRKPNEELKCGNIKSTVKHGGGSVMVWGCIAAGGTGNLIFIDSKMDQKLYLDVLKRDLRKSAEKFGILDRFHFYQNNYQKHKACTVQKWLLCNCPKVRKILSQFPDFNPIKNVGNELDRRVRTMTCKFEGLNSATD